MFRSGKGLLISESVREMRGGRNACAWLATVTVLGGGVGLGIPNPALAANLLSNGDFESAPILQSGQSAVPTGQSKLVEVNSASSFYTGAISGISGWNTTGYVFNSPTTNRSDYGLARQNATFGLPSSGQSAFVNNYNLLVNQSVSLTAKAGTTLSASIDFGTLGSDSDAGREGKFYLVAGTVSTTANDQFAPGAIILGEVSIANPTFTDPASHLTVGNDQYKTINISYTYGINDLALGMPVTVAFTTASGSVGFTYWDNATLTATPAAVGAPEPGALALLASLMLPVAARRARRRRI